MTSLPATYSEWWAPTTPGPTVVGLKILGNRAANQQQNALVFYDRNAGCSSTRSS
jgi:hypothetical protein